MVKGVSRSAGASSQSPAPAQALPTMQAGQNVHDPLTQLNSHMGYGAMAGLNPFADMGLNPNDPNMMQTMMNSPQFLQQMSSVMSNPAVLDQIIASNPQLAAMGPQVREVFQSERFREMMSNPESLRMMLQMSSMMQGGGGGNPFGGAGGGFPAPGTPANAVAGNPTSPTPASPAAPGNANPANPLGNFDPALIQQLLGGAGGGGGAAGGPFGAGSPFGLGGFAGGAATPATPADTRSPEERFQVQLQQLNDMGFTNASQNVRALLATAGNVHSAIEYILGGGGL